jgi:CheY-like chemotaxis protein
MTARARNVEILLIEDEPDLRTDLAYLLEDEGYRVRTAAHGAEALALLEGGARPAVILLDLMMPVMDGWETRAHLRARAALSNIPVVILSGVANDEEEIAALAVAAYVTKPTSVRQLCAIIDRALAGNQLKVS